MARDRLKRVAVLGLLFGLLLLVGKNRMASVTSVRGGETTLKEARSATGTAEKGSEALNGTSTATGEPRLSEQDEADLALKLKAHQAILAKHLALAKRRADQGAYQNTIYLDPHPALVPMLPENAPRTAWAQTSIPDLNIAGLPKAGTSHFYKILSTHKQATVFDPKTKEQCVRRLRDDAPLFQNWDQQEPNTSDQVSQRQNIVQQGLHSFHLAHHRRRQSKSANDKRLTVNGCIYYEDVELSWYYLRPPPSKKYFFLFRDPADWLWASFNFWQDSALDPGDFEGRGFWVNEKDHYRSPELFHEFVASGDKTTMGRHLLEVRKWTVEYPRRLKHMVGEPSSLFLRNEDLLPSNVNAKGGVLDQVSAFTGLDRNGFNANITGHLTNCNAHKGSKAACQDSQHSGAYAITGHRDMLPETRRLIYLQFWEECKIWKNEFGIEYPDCLNVVDKLE